MKLSKQPTMRYPVCGTQALVNPASDTVRVHLRKGGVRCDGRADPVEERGLFATQRHGWPQPEVAQRPTAPSITAKCPRCMKRIRIRDGTSRLEHHQDASGHECPGSGTVTTDGVEVRISEETLAKAMKKYTSAEKKKQARREAKKMARNEVSARQGERPLPWYRVILGGQFEGNRRRH